MASSKLLKEAIADAKAVRETAIANAKIALEEAFTPRLQSILSKKIQAEMEDMEGEDDLELGEEYDDDDVSTTEEPVDEGEDVDDAEADFEEYDDEEMSEEDDLDMEDDELDLESIIRELESHVSEEDENMDGVLDDPTGATMEEDEELDLDIEEDEDFDLDMDEDEDFDLDMDEDEDFDLDMDEEEDFDLDMDEDEDFDLDMDEDEDFDLDMDEDEDFDDTIDLDEILREMGYGDDDEDLSEEDDEVYADEDEVDLEAELEEAYSTIKSLKGTINEVNLLNAKLLYANKLFRSYNLTNEQKIKVVENLDRTGTVREVKLVYATLAESMKFGGTGRKVSGKKAMTEGLASKPMVSTAPNREIISESNELANRFKELAGIINK